MRLSELNGKCSPGSQFSDYITFVQGFPRLLPVQRAQVGLSITAIFSNFDRHIFGTFRESTFLNSDIKCLIGFSMTLKRVILNDLGMPFYSILKSVFCVGLTRLFVSLSETTTRKQYSHIYILSATRMLARDSSFYMGGYSSGFSREEASTDSGVVKKRQFLFI